MRFKAMMVAVSEQGRVLGPVDREFKVDFETEPWDAKVAVKRTEHELLEMVKEIILLDLAADQEPVQA